MAHWPAENIWQMISPVLPDFTVEVLPEIESTNSELMRRARAGLLAPVLLVAERQTAGRGRLGRDWQSHGHESLTFSLGLPLAPSDWSGLSLAVGVAIAHSLSPAVQLKWPNDLWLHDRKLGGILIETAGVAGQRYAVIGVGINIGPLLAFGLATPPAWLREITPDATAASTLGAIAAPLVQAVLHFQLDGFAASRAAYEARDALRDRPVRVMAAYGDSDGPVEGFARGVSAGGALLVQTPMCIKEITSAEVSVRPM